MLTTILKQPMVHPDKKEGDEVCVPVAENQMYEDAIKLLDFKGFGTLG
jgi:hypothetical protein